MIALALAACSSPPAGPGWTQVVRVDGDAVPKVSQPLNGGGLATRHGWIAASDVEGDRLHLVSQTAAYQVELPAGWAPGPLAFDRAGDVHVLLRGTGAVFTARPFESGPVVFGARPVCDAPRGIAEGHDGRIWVACAGGELVGLGLDVRELFVEPDLRDVVPIDFSTALVTRFRSAEVLVVDLFTGEVLDRLVPPSAQFSGTEFVPRVARRLVPWGDGAVLLAQLHRVTPLPEFVPGSEYYGSSAGGCGAVVQDTLMVVDRAGFHDRTTIAPGAAIDLAVPGDTYPDEFPEYAVVAGQLGGGRGVWSGFVGSGTCSGTLIETVRALPTAVALDEDGDLIIATRAPFQVVIGPLGTEYEAPLEGGLVAFHDAPASISCASCHPEGLDDGHVWQFPDVGARRTQAIGGGILDTAPFHWDGGLHDLVDLYTAVGVGRMGAPPPMGSMVDELGAWMDALPVAPADHTPRDPDLVARGEQLFHDPQLACASCHAPPRYTRPGAEDVGTGGTFEIPSLLGVAQRLPVMHDGCAENLAIRFLDEQCGGGDLHGVTSGLSREDVAALVAFLSTL